MHSAIEKNLQKKIIFIQTNDSLEYAYANMVRHETKSCLVLNDKKELVGLFTDVELKRSLRSGIQNRGAHKFSTLLYDPSAIVLDYMCTNFIVVNDEESLENLFRSKKHPGTCIVFKMGDNYKGFMSCVDVLKAVEAYCSQPQAL